MGTAVHAAARAVLEEKAKSGTLPPDSVATDCAAESLAEAVREGIMFDGPRGATQSGSDAMIQVTGMAKVYNRMIAPGVNPVIIETRLEGEVMPGLILTGQPDLVAREPNAVVDLKTGARAAGNHNGQIGAYSLLARTAGLEIEEASIDFIKRVPVKKPQPDPVHLRVRVALAEQIAANTIRHIAEDIRVFREGDDRLGLLPGDPAAFLANASSMLCSERYCPAHSCGPNGFCQEYNRDDAP